MTFPLVLTTLVLLIAALPAVLRQIVPGWTLHSTFFALLFFAPITAIVVAAVSNSKAKIINSDGFVELIGNENQAQTDAVSLIALAIALIILVRRLLIGGRLALAPSLLCLAAVGLTVLSNAQHFPFSLDRPVLGMLVVYLGCCVPGSVLAIGRGLTAGLYALLLISAVVGIVLPDTSVLACSVDKCGIGGTIFVGALNNENQFAITVVMALPFALLSLRKSARVMVAVATLLQVLLSGSRSSQLAVITVLLLAVVALAPRFRERSTALVPALGLGYLAALIFPMTVSSDSAFTGRGVLWKLALSMIGDSPILGSGESAWGAQAAIRNVGSNASYSPHNVWLDALLAGGVLATALVVIAISIQVFRLGPDRLWLLLPLAAGLIEGFTERSFTYYDLASTTAFVLPALIAAARPETDGSGPLKPEVLNMAHHRTAKVEPSRGRHVSVGSRSRSGASSRGPFEALHAMDAADDLAAERRLKHHR